MLPSFLRVTLTVFSVVASAVAQPHSGQRTAGDYLESIRGNEAALTAFFHRMPKGGDLHHHFSGAIYAETFFDSVAAQHFILDTSSLVLRSPGTPIGLNSSLVAMDSMSPAVRADFKARLIRLWSVKDFGPCDGAPDAHFFNTFGLFGPAIKDNVAPMLMEVKQRAIAEHTTYLETMFMRPSLPQNPAVARFYAMFDPLLRSAERNHDTAAGLLIMSGMLDSLRHGLEGRALAQKHHEMLVRYRDAILYRLRWTVLSDSTILKYEIGSFRLIQGSSIRYLDFTNPSGLDPDDFFTTDSFVISGSADSIMFCRFASFDDKDYIRPVLVDTSDATALDSIGHLFKTRYSALNVTPSSTAFGLSSTLKYVVEVRRTSDNVVLARLDTLKCYLNSSGQLRFRNYPESFNLRKAALPSSQGTSVYLKVHVLYDLPSSSSVVGYAYQFSGSNTPAEQIYSFANQEGLPTTIPPVYSSENGGANSLKKFANVTSLRPNPAANSMTVTFSQSEASEMLLEIYTTTGVKVSSLNVSAATLRSGSTTLDIHDLPDGNYTLAATSGGATIFTQFQVLHN